MASLYTHRAENIRKTWFLMTGFLVVVVALGWLLSQIYGDVTILYVAVGLSLVMNVTAYWFSDKVALAATGAKPADEAEYRELHRILENLAITAGLPKPRLYVVNDPAPNAFATGRDPKHAVVAVTTGLLERLDRSELEGVIAHELSHIGNRDILVMTVAVVLAGVIAMIADLFLRLSFYGHSGSDNKNPLLLIAGVVAIILAPLAAQLIQLAVSRKREFLADASGALLTRYPDGLASALQKISSYQAPMKRANHATAHLFISNPFGAHDLPARGLTASNAQAGAQAGAGKFIGKLFSTHPPVQERISALTNMHV